MLLETSQSQLFCQVFKVDIGQHPAIEISQLTFSHRADSSPGETDWALFGPFRFPCWGRESAFASRVCCDARQLSCRISSHRQKVELLLHTAGPELQEVYYTLVTTEELKPYSEILKVLDDYCSTSQYSLRTACIQANGTTKRRKSGSICM